MVHGAVHASKISYLSFNSNISFYHNKATRYGGAMHCNDHSGVVFDKNALVTFANNSAENGGAISIT